MTAQIHRIGFRYGREDIESSSSIGRWQSDDALRLKSTIRIPNCSNLQAICHSSGWRLTRRIATRSESRKSCHCWVSVRSEPLAEKGEFEPSRPVISRMRPRFHARFPSPENSFCRQKRGSPKVVDSRSAAPQVHFQGLAVARETSNVCAPGEGAGNG
jgi:hypothetical protein